MRSPIVPVIEIELGEKVRHLKLDLNAVCTFLELTGKDLLLGGFDQINSTDFRALLYACLKHEDEALTLDHVGDWVHPGNMKAVAEKLADLRKGAMPETNGDRPFEKSEPEAAEVAG